MLDNILQEKYYSVYDKKIYCKFNNNHNSPTVLFEAGLGDTSKTFENMQNELSKNYSTLSYDRVGLGKSAGEINVKSGIELLLFFNKLLQKVPIIPPFILVAHSFGSLISRLFASINKNPDIVKGIVLIDLAVEYKEKHFLNILNNKLKNKTEQYFKNPELNSEKIDKIKTYQEIVKYKRKFKFPVTVISRGLPDCYGNKWPEKDMLELEHQLQYGLNDLSDDFKIIIAKRSGHYIHLDQPELVIKEINSLVKNNK
jgi:pimeloyl-ACP methyl ester carboxylesterase